MAIQIAGQNLKTGAPGQAFPQDQQNAPLVTELNPRYYQNVYAGNVFYAVNSAAQALSLSGTTTYTGLTVANPAGSGKNLALLEALWCTTIAITGIGAVILATGTTTAQTAGSSTGPVSALLGSGANSVAKVGASCTYAANPTFLRPGTGISWVTAGTTQTFQQYKDEIGGALVIAPGQQVSFLSITTANTGIGYFSWAELPI
jgi:hypothetical protein